MKVPDPTHFKALAKVGPGTFFKHYSENYATHVSVDLNWMQEGGYHVR
jgi:hypothetical protein